MPGGISREQRRNLTNLARHLRDTVDFEGLAKRLEAIAFGRNPDSGVYDQGITHDTQLRAANMLYDRAYGQAPQHVVVQAELRSELSVQPGAAFANMSRAELEQHRNKLLELKRITQKTVVDV